jgi:acyl dehydratase
MAGKFYEELEEGAVYRHAVTRTVTEMDNTLFTCLTMNPQPLHLDEEFGRNSLYGTRIVNSMFTLALVMGVGVSDLTLGTTLGNLGLEKATFPNPVRHGDTIRSETKILRKRPSNSNHRAGIVWFEHSGYNQRGELVARAERVGLMMRAPEVAA